MTRNQRRLIIHFSYSTRVKGIHSEKHLARLHVPVTPDYAA